MCVCMCVCKGYSPNPSNTSGLVHKPGDAALFNIGTNEQMIRDVMHGNVPVKCFSILLITKPV